jgi:hypothetical protein
MEPLWSPVVATGGNRSQIAQAREPPNQAKTVAVDCDQLPIGAHGKGRVDTTSLLLKGGSPSWLRKRVESREPGGSQDSRLTARIERATPGELRRMRFESGLMAAKVEAACRFVEAPGGAAAIGALGDTVALVRGEAGTRGRPEPAP